MIVVDANVIAYLLLPGAASRRAEELLRRDHEWAAPLLWRSEIRNVFAGVLRRRAVSLKDAVHLISQAEALLRGREYAVASASVLELVERSKCSAYDCEYVALARDLGVPLVTHDARLVASFPDDCLPFTEAAG